VIAGVVVYELGKNASSPIASRALTVFASLVITLPQTNCFEPEFTTSKARTVHKNTKRSDFGKGESTILDFSSPSASG
jgi:hypothetical protein